MCVDTKRLSVLMFDAAFPPPVIGGKEKQAFLLSKTLLQRDVRVEALSYIHNGNRSGRHDEIDVYRFRAGIRSIFPLAFFILKKRKVTKILHIHTPSRIGKFMVFVGFISGYKLVFKFPGQNIIDMESLRSKFLWKIIAAMVSSFVVLEGETYKRLIKLGVANRKILYVENGVEMQQPKATTLINATINLIFVGRLVPIKLCDQLIYACGLLHNQELDFKLTIIGDGPLKQELQHLVRELGLENYVFFQGNKPDPVVYMRDSDILILPSLSEGMSNVLLEAVSVGLPIVATDVGSARAVVGSFGEQFLCQPSNPECLAQKIYSLSANPRLRQDYSNYLYKRGCDSFSIEAVANKYIQKYKELV